MTLNVFSVLPKNLGETQEQIIWKIKGKKRERETDNSKGYTIKYTAIVFTHLQVSVNARQ